MPSQAEVDAFLPPFEPRQLLDPADPVSIGAMVGPEAFEEVRYLAHLSRSRRSTRSRRSPHEFERGVRPRLGRARSTATGATTPRPSSSRWARCSARSRTSSTSMREHGRRDRGARDHVVSAVPGSRPCGRRSAAAQRRRASRRRWRRARAGCSSTDVAMALDGHPSPGVTPSSPVWAGARSPRRRCATVRASAAADGSSR